MKKAPTVKLSLRKLLTAMLAVGPVAILPSPVWAALPTQNSITLQNGSATVTQTGATVATITSSDRAVLLWGTGLFNIAAGEVYNFQMPAGGAVLNKTNVADTVNIGGQLDSNGKVFVLAPGGTINVNTGATITATGGLILSTLAEENGAFLATGDLLYTPGVTNGSIVIGGTGVTPISVGGNITAVSGSISHGATSVTGDMILRSVTSGAAMNIAQAGGMLVGGNLTVSTNAGAITQGAGTITVGNTTGMSQNASFSTGGGNVAITLNNAANDFQNIAVSAGTGAGGDVIIQDANIIRFNASTVGGGLTVTAAGNSTLSGTAIGTNAAIAVTGAAAFNTTNDNSSVNIANGSSVVGVLSGTITNNASFTFNGTGNVTTGVIVATNGTSGGNRTGVTINTTGNLTVGGAISTLGNNSSVGSNITLTAASINHTVGTLTAGNASRGGGITMNATAGNITVGNLDSYNRISLTAGAGSISQVGGTSIVTRNANSGVTHVLNAQVGTVVLDSLTNSFAGNATATNVVQISAATANVTNLGNLVLGTTNVTNNLNLVVQGGNHLTLGAGTGNEGQRVSVGGVLTGTVSGAGTITDNNYSVFNVMGGLNLTTGGGAVTIDAASANGILSPRVVFGAVNIAAGAGAVTVTETTPLNLGNITAASLTASSTTEGIIDSGNLTVVGGTVTLSAVNNSTITLDSTGHNVGTLNIGGTAQATVASANDITVGTAGGGLTGNLSVTTASGKNIVSSGTVTGGLMLNSGGTLNFTGTTSVTGNLTASSQGAMGQIAGSTVTVSGDAAVMAANAAAVTLGGANNFATVTLNNSTGAVTIADINNLTIQGTAAGLVTATAGAAGGVASQWNLTLGNLTVGSLDAIAASGGGGDSGTITQASKTMVHSEGLTKFTTTDNNIVVGNAGNSFGRVEIRANAGASRTVTVSEDGTMKLGFLNSRGTATLTSRTGSIIEDPDANVTVTQNGTLNLNAAAGSVLVGNTTTRSGAFTTGGNVQTVNISAPTGAAAVISSAGNGNITLANITANSLTVTGNNIGQSQPAKVFGSASFVATRNITLNNAANNFGRVSLSSANVDGMISITENGTLNLGGATMVASANGTFTATSVNGDIIDTGLAGLKPGGVVGTPGTAFAVVTLNAANGNIVLDDPTTDFPTLGGVVFNGKNVTLSPLGNAPLYLGSSGSTSVAGNLTVTSAIGNILSSGNISVTGDAMFQSGNGNITLAQSGNKFGTLKFTGNQVAIVESDDTVLVTGSSALGSAQLSSGGNITVSNKGGTINFNNTVFLSATGSITLPKVIQAVGTLTVNAAGTKDLSLLSKSADLNSKDPTNLGTGTYLPPGQ